MVYLRVDICKIYKLNFERIGKFMRMLVKLVFIIKVDVRVDKIFVWYLF